MSLELASFEHNLNQLGRETNEVFAELSCIFIPFHKGQESKAIERKMMSFEALPSEFIEHLKHEKTAAILKTSQRNFPYLFSKNHYVAAIFCDLDDITQDRLALYEDEPQKNDKFMAFRCLWFALSLWQNLRHNTDKTTEHDANIYGFEENPVSRAKQSLLADCFAAACMELSGHRACAKILQKRRADLCAEKHIGYAPED